MILVIEDDVPTAKALARLAQSLDRQVVVAATGAQARDALRDHHPNLVFLDLMLPDTHGLKLLKTIRETPSLSDVSVVVYSASNRDEDRVEAAALGAREFIVKG